MAGENHQSSSDLFAARTEAFQQATATNFFKTLLLIVGSFGAIASIVYVLNYSVAQRPVREPFDNKQAYAKVTDLEKQLQVLKSEITTVEPTNPLMALFQSAMKSAVTYWALLAFLFGVGIALYVKVKFKIDYFESYRDLATKKMLSDFYRTLGDLLLGRNELEASAAAYRDALAINPTNIKASYGVAKATIFQPLPGQRFYASDIADAKIDYLIDRSSRVGGKRDFAQLYFLKSFNRLRQADIDGAIKWLANAINVDPSYAPAYTNSAVIFLNSGDFDNALAYLQKSYELEPSDALANANLGSCYMMLARFDKAIEHLEQANKASANFPVQLALGDAYRYAGRIADALRFHKILVANTEIPGIDSERYASGEWTSGFMPVHDNDRETIKKGALISTFAAKKMEAYLALALDSALVSDFEKAGKCFALARECDAPRDYTALILNRINATLSFAKPTGAPRDWLEKKNGELAA